MFRRLTFDMTRAAPPPPEDHPAEAFLYGLAQPLLGARLVLREPTLRQASVFPALVVTALCMLLALGELADGPWHFLKRFYVLFVALAPLPSLLFGRHYARMAVDAWARLGFGQRQPRLLSLRVVAKQWLMETVLIWLGAAPGLFLLHHVPILGSPAALFVSFAWALHWVVLNALESARTLPLPSTVEDETDDFLTTQALSLAPVDRDAEDTQETGGGLEDTTESSRLPWYARPWLALGGVFPAPFSRFFLKFASALTWMSAHSRDELMVLEARPFLCAGFALTTAALLGIPGLNLIFRPVTLVGAAHILGHLEDARTRLTT